MLELGLITLAKASPLLRIMRKPFPKLRARGDLFQPEIDLRLFLSQTSWPKPVHQDAGAIVLVRRFIHSLEF